MTQMSNSVPSESSNFATNKAMVVCEYSMQIVVTDIAFRDFDAMLFVHGQSV